MEAVLYTDTFKKTFKKVLNIPSVVIDDPIFRLHYKFTGLCLLFGSIFVSGYQFFGNPIMCIQRDDIPEQLLNTYCWIEGTFTLPKALFKKVGTEIVYPGVDKYQEGDETVEHVYYQWICFVLFLQAVMFCIPYVLWRTLEMGKMKGLVQKLRSPIVYCKPEDRATKGLDAQLTELAKYFNQRRLDHQSYAMKYWLCEMLNLVIVISQIFFIDALLGGEFTKYGLEVVKYANEEQENRIDPMMRVFPRITKCTFHKYGSSGDVQKHDALCLLPLNILNEKIFIFLWFWLIILAIIDGIVLLFRITLLVNKDARFFILSLAASLLSRKTIKELVPNFKYGNWFVLYRLADNIENIHFHNFLKKLNGEDDYKQSWVPYKTAKKSQFEVNIVNLEEVDKGASKKFSKQSSVGESDV